MKRYMYKISSFNVEGLDLNLGSADVICPDLMTAQFYLNRPCIQEDLCKVSEHSDVMSYASIRVSLMELDEARGVYVENDKVFVQGLGCSEISDYFMRVEDEAEFDEWISKAVVTIR